MQHIVALRSAPAASAIGVADGEGRRRARAQFEDRIVEAELVRQFQPQHGHAPIGNGILEAHDIGLLVVALGALQRANVEVARAQRLRALGRNARRLAQFDRDETRERGHVDRLRKSERDLVEIGHGIGAIGGRRRFRRRQQRDEFRASVLRLQLDALQRLPGFGRTELQRARADPAPFASDLRRHGHDAFRPVFRSAACRPGIRIDEDRDGIPCAQKLVRHDARAVCAHEPVSREFRRSGRGRCHRRSGLRLCGRWLFVGLRESELRQRGKAGRGGEEREARAVHVSHLSGAGWCWRWT